MLLPDILNAIGERGAVEDPPPLDVRHPAWPGKDKQEIEMEILARRQRAVENAIRRGREKKAREGRERKRREQEARWWAEVEEAIVQEHGTLESQIIAALEAEFGPGFRV